MFSARVWFNNQLRIAVSRTTKATQPWNQSNITISHCNLQSNYNSHFTNSLPQAAYLRKSQVTQPVASGCPGCLGLHNLQKTNPKLAKPLTEVVANQTLIFCNRLLTTSALGSLMGNSHENLENQLCKYPNSISQASEAIQTSNMQQPTKSDTIASYRLQEFPTAATRVVPGWLPAASC